MALVTVRTWEKTALHMGNFTFAYLSLSTHYKNGLPLFWIANKKPLFKGFG